MLIIMNTNYTYNGKQVFTYPQKNAHILIKIGDRYVLHKPKPELRIVK